MPVRRTSIVVACVRLTPDRQAPLRKLNHALGGLLDEFGLVQFVPLDITRQTSVESLMQRIDMATQYGEDEDVRVPRDADVSPVLFSLTF